MHNNNRCFGRLFAFLKRFVSVFAGWLWRFLQPDALAKAVCEVLKASRPLRERDPLPYLKGKLFWRLVLSILAG